MYRARLALRALQAARAALEASAATKLQSRCRGVLTRARVGPQILESRRAARCVQGLLKVRRARLLAREHRRRRDAATWVQAHWRGHAARLRYHALLRRREAAALRVQCAGRRLLARRELAALRQAKKEAEAATQLQRVCRGVLTRRRTGPLILARRQAAFRIQGLLHIQRAKLELQRLKEERAARCIQGLLLIQRAKVELRRLRAERAELERKSATLLQKRCRGVLARKFAWPWMHERRQAATRVQGLAKVRRARLLARRLRRERAAIGIQCMVRCALARQRVQDVRRLNATRRIQGAWRCCLARRAAMQLRAKVASQMLEALREKQQNK